MAEFSSRKIINNYFHVNNGIIIGRDMMVQLGLTDKFKYKVLQWDVTTVHMKEPSGLLRQSVLTKYKIYKVVIQTSEPASTWESTKQMVTNLDSTYAKADFKQVANKST